jgi:hypothetical protein
MKKALLILLLLTTTAFAEGLTKEVRFARGAYSSTINGAVIRGDRDTYILKAAKGQHIWIAITSVESNAVFDLYSPGDELFEQEAKKMDGRLPETGPYKIIVGGTRGNATYKLTVTIK